MPTKRSEVPVTSNSSAVNHCAHLLDFSPDQLARSAPLQSVDFPAFEKAGVRVSVLRLDRLHPLVSGNKIFKLYNHLERYFKVNAGLPIASFGGPWSNHLHAMAAIGAALGVPTIGVIRGEPVHNATIGDLRAQGMRIHYVSRADYRRRYEPAWLAQLEQLLGPACWVPEGGGGELGASACAAIGRDLMLRGVDIDAVTLACGTGTTLSGLLNGLAGADQSQCVQVDAFSALKGYHQKLVQDVTSLLKVLGGSPSQWCIHDRFHCGGFARFPQALRNFVTEFEEITHLLLDPVYTAKMFYGVVQLATEGYWRKGSHIVAIHSGGLQGRRGYYD